MLHMDHMYLTLSDNHYTTDYSNVKRQEPNPKELQKKLTSYLTILTCPKPPKYIQQ